MIIIHLANPPCLAITGNKLAFRLTSIFFRPPAEFLFPIVEAVEVARLLLAAGALVTPFMMDELPPALRLS